MLFGEPASDPQAAKQEIRGIVTDLACSWNAANARAYTADFTCDAAQTFWCGTHADNRAAIRRHLQWLFLSYPGTKLAITPAAVHFQPDGLAVAHTQTEIVLPASRGVAHIQALGVFVLAYLVDAWMVISAEITHPAA